MGFFEKLKRAFIKIKGKLIVAAILVIAITIFAVAPLNILKGVSVSLITMLVYKKLSRFMKATQTTR